MYEFDPRTDRPSRIAEREGSMPSAQKNRVYNTMSIIRDGSIALASLCFAFSYLPGHTPIGNEAVQVTKTLLPPSAKSDSATTQMPASYDGYQQQSVQVESMLLERAEAIRAQGKMVKAGGAKPAQLPAAQVSAPQVPAAVTKTVQESTKPEAQQASNTQKGTLHPAPFVDEQAAQSIEAKRQAFTGDKALVRIGYHFDGTRMSVAEKSEQVRAILSTVPDEWTAVYKASEEKLRMYVFTDSTCPFCQRLHASIPELNAAGVTVQYFLFPRDMASSNGAMTPTAINLNNAWCSPNQQEALDAAFQGYKIPAADCADLPDDDLRVKDPAQQHFAMARSIFNVEATPTIFTSTGVSTAGFSGVASLLRNIGL